MKETYLKIAVPVPIHTLFDYLPPDNCDRAKLQPGIRILVPYRNKTIVGLLIKTSNIINVTQTKLKQAIELLDQEPIIDNSLFSLLEWASNYYHHPIGEVFSHAMPLILRQGKPTKLSSLKIENYSAKKEEPLKLNNFQLAAVNTILEKQHYHSYLLDGVTGSGKTEVYLQIINEIINKGKQALILVPEISLTPQTVQRFQNRFQCKIAVVHSNLTPRQKLNSWYLAKENHAPIVIGTRSVIFSSLKNLGVIIVDEEHDPSYKQQDGFRYNARDLAVARAKMQNIPIILGSATPSLESQLNSQIKKYTLLSLPSRANANSLPQFRVVDLKSEPLDEGLSVTLLKSIAEHLQRKKQILLFLNRRGYAPVLLCHQCGWLAKCGHCAANLIYHQMPLRLHCHHCGMQQKVMNSCPECQCENLIPLGSGTERIENALEKNFPNTKIARLDKDTARKKGALETLIQNFHAGENQILIGTQMLSKGHHFKDVSLAAIIDVDSGLFSADPRASERMGQLIMQVAGRAGRETERGEVVLQTRCPEHHLLQPLFKYNYLEFSEKLLVERKNNSLPPFVNYILFRAESLTQENSLNFLKKIKSLAQNIISKSPYHPEIPINLTSTNSIKITNDVTLLGPIPSLLEKKSDRYRAQLILQSINRQQLHRIIDLLLPQIKKIKHPRSLRWHLDVDPLEIM